MGRSLEAYTYPQKIQRLNYYSGRVFLIPENAMKDKGRNSFSPE
jgi:hypothetical protein